MFCTPFPAFIFVASTMTGQIIVEHPSNHVDFSKFSASAVFFVVGDGVVGIIVGVFYKM